MKTHKVQPLIVVLHCFLLLFLKRHNGRVVVEAGRPKLTTKVRVEERRKCCGSLLALPIPWHHTVS